MEKQLIQRNERRKTISENYQVLGVLRTVARAVARCDQERDTELELTGNTSTIHSQ